uniref:Cytochrome c oxidase subunit 2 n=2 Tax=Aglaiogyrodactylus ctenistus TaxID=1261538 RepID=A0A067YSB0_9PLAT|nr:cytochrome c oxidase subunit II [Aglaiogyrodactylus ctenistus]
MQNVFVYYNMVIYVSILCLFLCLFVIFIIALNSNINHTWLLATESHVIELLWTIIPVFLVSFLCLLNLENINKEISNSVSFVIKVIGQQWRWSYENLLGIEYLSNYQMDRSVVSVDTPVYMPYNNTIQILLSSVDVIHAFSLPDLGLKIDSVPGRVNHLIYNSNIVGIFNGYCSELCGVGHSFMPNHY